MEIKEISDIAQEYGIVLVPTRKTIHLKHGNRTFVGDSELILKARCEEEHRQVFSWIARECQRLDALAAAEDELVRRARIGEHAAREAIIEECIERVRGNTQTTSEHLLQEARRVAWEHLEEALQSQYPWSYGTLYSIVRVWVKETYRL
jgi:hypothetical protein